MTQRCLNDIYVTGIDTKRQTGGQCHFLNGFQHHFFFINTIHTHIDVQNVCTHFFLLLCHLIDDIHAAFSQRCLQLLFASRIDTLTDDKERTVNVNFLNFSLGSYHTFVLFHDCWWCQIFCLFHQKCNMLRCGTTATT